MTYLLIPVLDLQSCCFSFSWSGLSLFSLPETCPRVNILVNPYLSQACAWECRCWWVPVLAVSACPSGCAQQHQSQAGSSRKSQKCAELLCTKTVQLFISDWEFCSIRSFGEASITFCRSKDQNNISFYMKQLFQWAMPLLFSYVHFVTFLLTRDFCIYLC